MARSNDELERILQSCLEMVQSGNVSVDEALARYPEDAHELRPRLEAALWLSAKRGALDPRPEFVSASRQRLMARLQQEQAAQALPVSQLIMGWFMRTWHQIIPAGGLARRRFAFQLAMILVLIVTMFTGGTSVAFAAQDAIPGDYLYPVKTSIEATQLFFTPSLSGGIRLHIDFSSRRVVEIQSLILETRYDWISATVDRYEKHIDRALTLLDRLVRRNAAQASELAVELHKTLASQATTFLVLSEMVPSPLSGELNRAAMVSQSGEASVTEVLETIGVPLNTDTPGLPPADTRSASETPIHSPTASLTSTASATTSSTATQTPTSTSTVTFTVTPSPSVPVATTVAVKTVAPRDDEPPAPTNTPVPKPTDPPQPTDPPKPTKTPKPLPSPTRRPPKEGG